MNTLLQDLRFALRQMRRSPGFAITAVFILGLGIAANVIVFGVVQALILQPLDAPRPDRLVTFANREQGYPAFSYPEVRDVRAKLDDYIAHREARERQILEALATGPSTIPDLVARIYAEGRTIACLYTDLRNPFSNRCYAKIGFRPVCTSLHFHRRLG